MLEGISSDLAGEITDRLTIPTIGIGAGKNCDGQIQVYHDILGMYGDLVPNHTKKYADISNLIKEKLMEYKLEVSKRKFPIHKFSKK